MKSRILQLSSVWSLMLAMLFMGSCSPKMASKAADVAPPDPYVGTWNYQVQDTPDGTLRGTLQINKDGDNYKAMLMSGSNETAIENVAITGSTLTGNFDYQGYTVNLKGDFSGTSLNGNMLVEGMSFPLMASKAEMETK